MSTTTTKPQSRKKGGVLDGLVRPFGIASATLLTGFAGFQLALAMGAPWGDHVWGGSFSPELPTGMRFASAAAAVLLLGMATTVLARANVIRRLSTWRSLTGVTWGIVAGYLALDTLGNLASQSDVEKYLLSLATLVLAVLIAFVAHRGPRVGNRGGADAPAAENHRDVRKGA